MTGVQTCALPIYTVQTHYAYQGYRILNGMQEKLVFQLPGGLSQLIRAFAHGGHAAQHILRALEQKAALYRKYGKATAELILEGKVRIGMTREMCREAWGSQS